MTIRYFNNLEEEIMVWVAAAVVVLWYLNK